MSSASLKRLPRHVQQLLKIYEKGASNFSPYRDARVRSLLKKTSPDYMSFQAYKLRTEGAFNSKDFPPTVAKSLEPLFEKPLELDHLESLSTRELFKEDVLKDAEEDEDSIHSSSSRSPRRTSDYEAKLITSFASYLDPFKEVPEVNSIEQSFKWYIKLLNNTPIFLILKHSNRLFSESSLNQIDKPLSDLRKRIRELGNANSEDLDSPRALRNYHLTDLSNHDLFTLAVKSQSYFEHRSILDFDEVLNEIREGNTWEDINEKEDKLCDIIRQSSRMELTDSLFNPVEVSSFEKFIERFKLWRIIEDISDTDVRSVLPFDFRFDSHHILCIEDPVINDDHGALFDVISQSGFEVVAARVSTQKQSVADFFVEVMGNSEESQPTKNMNYEKMLEIAKEHRREVIHSSFYDVMKRLAEMNLVRVEEGCNRNCIYLVKE